MYVYIYSKKQNLNLVFENMWPFKFHVHFNLKILQTSFWSLFFTHKNILLHPHKQKNIHSALKHVNIMYELSIYTLQKK